MDLLESAYNGTSGLSLDEIAGETAGIGNYRAIEE